MIAFRDASSLEKKSAHPIRAPPITPCARQENGTIVPVDLPSSDCWENDPSSNSTPYQGPFLLKFFSRSQEFAKCLAGRSCERCKELTNVHLEDPADPRPGLDLKAMAVKFAETYNEKKLRSTEAGLTEPRAIPRLPHPIFKGKPVNYDPRERFIADFMAKRGDYDVFHAY